MGMTFERLASHITEEPTVGIEHTLDTMHYEEELLRKADLPHVADFLTMYATATADVQQRRDNDEFAEPEQLERSVSNFFGLYKQPVLHLIAGESKSISPSWRPLLLSPAALSASPLHRQLSGMIAHIEVDLPVSALDSGAVHNEAYMAHDWDLVNQALRTAAYHVSERSIAIPGIVRFMRTPIRRMVADLGMIAIEEKRDVARLDAFELNRLANQEAQQSFIAKLQHKTEPRAAAVLGGNWSVFKHCLPYFV